MSVEKFSVWVKLSDFIAYWEAMSALFNICNLLALFVASHLEGALCSGSCCGTIQVIHKDVSDTAARVYQPNIFTNYTIEADLVNGRVHYTSHDGTQAITYDEDHGEWLIQTAGRR